MIQQTCLTREQILNLISGKCAPTAVEPLWDHIERCDKCQEIAMLCERAPARSDVTMLQGEVTASKLSLRALTAGSSENFERLKLIPGVLADLQRCEKQLGAYELIEELGRGGMGIVYRARHIHVGRECAVKLLHTDKTSEAAVSRFKQEMSVIGQLDHPNVVQVYDAGQVDDEYFIAMELLRGSTVAQIVSNSGPLSVSDASWIAKEAAQGLAHAHEQGILHRDVKPSNLMVGNAVTVVDFGVSYRNDFGVESRATTGTGLFLGTLEFASPEQLRGDAKVDERSDVYSLGATLYFMLTGYSPLGVQAGDTPVEMLQSIRERIVVPINDLNPTVPRGLASFIRKMLSSKKRWRPLAMSEVVTQLAEFVDGPAKLTLILEGNDSKENGSCDSRCSAATLEPNALRQLRLSKKRAKQRWILAAISTVILFASVLLVNHLRRVS